MRVCRETQRIKIIVSTQELTGKSHTRARDGLLSWPVAWAVSLSFSDSNYIIFDDIKSAQLSNKGIGCSIPFVSAMLILHFHSFTNSKIVNWMAVFQEGNESFK